MKKEIIDGNTIIAIDTNLCDCSEIQNDIILYCNTILSGTIKESRLVPNRNGILKISLDIDDGDLKYPEYSNIKKFISANVKLNRNSCCWVRIPLKSEIEIIGDYKIFNISVNSRSIVDVYKP